MPAFQTARPRRAMALAALALLSTSLAVTAGPREDERARNATRVVREIQSIPESAIPDKLLDQAHAIAVIPDTLKAGLFIGGRRGHGLLAMKSPDGTWSAPSFIKLTGGSIGLQAGVQSSDIVLVFNSPRGLDGIVNGEFTLGADAGVAAGPVGRTAAVATDGELKAEIWSWSRARGLFAGVALDGAVLSIDDEANVAAYGAGTTPRMIFEGRARGRAGEAITAFRDSLEEATAAARYARGTERPVGSAHARPSAPAASVEGEVRAGAAVATPVDPARTGEAARPGTFEPVDPSDAQPADEDGTRVEPLP
jgi:lipid-binding SYLF domain-containing protein